MHSRCRCIIYITELSMREILTSRFESNRDQVHDEANTCTARLHLR